MTQKTCVESPKRPRRSLIGLAIALLAFPVASWATPQFARVHQADCSTCHVVPPMLNETGLAFEARGYRLPVEPQSSHGTESVGAVPVAAWITGRFEDQGRGGASDALLPKVELISGGPLGESGSYFAEWRIVSLSLNGDGSLRDRGGRFEDLFADWSSGRHGFKVGQYRSLNQVDVSRRLSASEPELFGNGLRTGDDYHDPRLASLSRFSPSSRSPSIGWSYRSIAGEGAADGLFHHLTVPFTGELSIPLSAEARDTASFELAGPKGLYAETFYRTGRRTLGGHVFVSDASWLATVLGTYDWRDLFVTAGVGVDDQEERDTRGRSTLQAEYLFRRSDRWRAAVGLRIEEVSGDGRRASYVPYAAVAGPNTLHTLLFQIQYKDREGSDSFVFDVSLLF